MIGLDYLTNILSSVTSLPTVERIWAIVGIMVIISIGIIIIDSLRFMFTGNFDIGIAFNSFNTAWTVATVALFYFAYLVGDNSLSMVLMGVGTIASCIGFSPNSLSNDPDKDLLADPHDME